MSKFSLGLIILLSFKLSIAQQPRLGIEAGTGFSLPLTSVSGYPSPLRYAAINFAPLKLGYVSIEYNLGVLWGKGTMTTDIETSNSNIGNNVFQFKTTYTSYGISGYINLHHLFRAKKQAKKLIPYLQLGFASMNALSNAENQTLNTRKIYTQDYFISVYGVLVKVKLNNTFDWIVNATLNLTETKYLDAIFYDKKYDGIVNIKGGLVFYPGAKKKRNYIAWQPNMKICPNLKAY
jgi:hypothetical protein